jgi:hypothetical protein
MLNMKGQVVAVRYGVIEEDNKENIKWAKVTTLEDVIEDSDGFVGQRVIEYSVPREHVDLVVANARHENTVPNTCDLTFISAMSGGKAVLKCVGLKKAIKNDKAA